MKPRPAQLAWRSLSADLGRNRLLTDNVPLFPLDLAPRKQLAQSGEAVRDTHFVNHQPLAQAVAMDHGVRLISPSRRPQRQGTYPSCAPPQRLNESSSPQRRSLCGYNIRPSPHKMASSTPCFRIYFHRMAICDFLRLHSCSSGRTDGTYLIVPSRPDVTLVPGAGSWFHSALLSSSSSRSALFLLRRCHGPRSTVHVHDSTIHTTFTSDMPCHCHLPVMILSPDRRVQCPYRESAHASWARPEAAICGL